MVDFMAYEHKIPRETTRIYIHIYTYIYIDIYIYIYIYIFVSLNKPWF